MLLGGWAGSEQWVYLSSFTENSIKRNKRKMILTRVVRLRLGWKTKTCAKELRGELQNWVIILYGFITISNIFHNRNT